MTDLSAWWGLEDDDLDDDDLDDDLVDLDGDDDDLDEELEDDFDSDLDDLEGEDDEAEEVLELAGFGLDEELEAEESELPGGVDASCPYCGVGVEVVVDPLGGEVQEYVEDCEVCCQPWSVRVTLGPDGGAAVELGTLDGEG